MNWKMWISFLTHQDLQVLPKAPPDLVKELSRRYILAYEAITQESFQPTTSSQDPDQRIVENLKSAGVI